MMRWPQWLVIGLHIFSLGIGAADHGKPRSPQNFWYQLIGSAISLWLLWIGGFFSQ